MWTAPRACGRLGCVDLPDAVGFAQRPHESRHPDGLKNIGIASKLPDALTGGIYIGEQAGILLYTAAGSIPAATQTMITNCKIGSQQGSVFGGTGSVSDAALASFNTVLNSP